MNPGNEPPPMAVFLVLDREIPATAQNLSRDNVPKVLGEMLIYGKETDRPARVDRVGPQVPMHRGGEAIEVARAILWLLSDEASYTTGTFIDVAGGR